MNLLQLLQVFFCLIVTREIVMGIVRKHCEGPIINNIHHSKEVLKTGIYYPRSLSYDHTTNTLFFSYCPDVYNYTVRSAKINLNTKELQDIDGVNNGFAQTVDVETKEIYIGGSDGIYLYNTISNTAELFAANNTVIWKLYAKDAVYFSEYPSQFLYKIAHGVVSRFRDLEETLAKNFVIDNYDYLYFTNNSGLYRQRKGTKDAVYYEGTADMYVSGLTVNKLGDVFASTNEGIYAVKRNKQALEKIVDVDYAYGITFDGKNDIIYSNQTSIVRLKPSSDQDCF